MSSNKKYDCVVCGSCTVDVLAHPFSLEDPVGISQLVRTDPIQAVTGGLASNAGTAMTKLGMQATVFSATGDDLWGDVIRKLFARSGVNTEHLLTLPKEPSSCTIVLIDEAGNRSFAHSQGAPKKMTPAHYFDNMSLFANSHSMLIGYYSLMPNLEDELPEILRRIREVGCLTAMDAAGDGGSMQPLDALLPHLDFYVPSFEEATHQTGLDEPKAMIETFRSCGAPGVLGVKLGADGALLSDRADSYVEITAVTPPGDVVDTTGAGDSFYAGLISGVRKGYSLADAGKIAAAAGACCVTAMGASAGVRSWEETAKLAEIL